MIAQAFRFGLSVDEIASGLQVRAVVPAPDRAARGDRGGDSRTAACPRTPRRLLDLKKKGFSDERLAELTRPVRRRGGQRKRRALGIRPVFKRIDTCAAEFRIAHALSLFLLRGRRPSVRPSARRSRPTAARSSSWAAAPTASARASSSTIAACTRSMRCARPATRPSWSTAIRRPSRPTTTPPTASTSSR